jgi:hypothetical protein
MVQIRLKLCVAFVLAASAIAPVVALPLPPQFQPAPKPPPPANNAWATAAKVAKIALHDPFLPPVERVALDIEEHLWHKASLIPDSQKSGYVNDPFLFDFILISAKQFIWARVFLCSSSLRYLNAPPKTLRMSTLVFLSVELYIEKLF